MSQDRVIVSFKHVQRERSCIFSEEGSQLLFLLADEDQEGAVSLSLPASQEFLFCICKGVSQGRSGGCMFFGTNPFHPTKSLTLHPGKRCNLLQFSTSLCGW